MSCIRPVMQAVPRNLSVGACGGQVRFASKMARKKAGDGESTMKLVDKKPKKLLPGRTRSRIYYTFDCTVKMTDGSTITRRSQFPRVEMQTVSDIRNNPVFNESRADLAAENMDAAKKRELFIKKFRLEDAEEPKEAQSVEEAEGADTKEGEAKEPPKSAFDSYLDLIGGGANIRSGSLLKKSKGGKKKR